MSAPTTTIYQTSIQNQHARNPLIIPVLVVCNTADEELERNIAANSALNLHWIGFAKPHDLTAIMVGGGPSLADTIMEVQRHKARGGVIFAMNAASGYLTHHGIEVDFQVIADAKAETAQLVDIRANHRLIASQADELTMMHASEAPGGAALWHLCIDETMDRLFPDHRRKAGGYALVGGGAAVGNSAMALAYVMGYRKFEVFGYDSSHHQGWSHAYQQPMNDFIPTLPVEWAGKHYIASVAMKAQAEKFQITGQALKQAGCEITVHGHGLLPAMWNTKPEDLTERDKYRLVWGAEEYRRVSPGEAVVPVILEQMKPSGMVIDFGCGTGRASLALREAGLDVLLIDFADNCRDEEAIGLPFLEWDMTYPMPPSANYGICCDVMEHIPPETVDIVIRNIMAAAKTVFFQISTVPDMGGKLIGNTLHLSVSPPEWWAAKFASLGFVVQWQDHDDISCQLIVRR